MPIMTQESRWQLEEETLLLHASLPPSLSPFPSCILPFHSEFSMKWIEVSERAIPSPSSPFIRACNRGKLSFWCSAGSSVLPRPMHFRRARARASLTYLVKSSRNSGGAAAAAATG